MTLRIKKTVRQIHKNKSTIFIFFIDIFLKSEKDRATRGGSEKITSKIFN